MHEAGRVDQPKTGHIPSSVCDEISMEFQETMTFLEQEEERLVGKAVKVPINSDLWREKCIFTYQCLEEFIALLNAADVSYNPGCKHIMEIFNHKAEEIKALDTGKIPHPIFPDNCFELTSVPDNLRERVFIQALKKFMDSGYEPPLNLEDIMYAFSYYWHYLEYTFDSIKFFYPTVNALIDLAGMKLTWVACRYVMTGFVIGKGNAQARPGGLARQERSNDQSEAIRLILTELNINDLQIFRKDKRLRAEFLEKCREVTKKIDKEARHTSEKDSVPLAETTILKKANKILKGNPSV